MLYGAGDCRSWTQCDSLYVLWPPGWLQVTLGKDMALAVMDWVATVHQPGRAQPWSHESYLQAAGATKSTLASVYIYIQVPRATAGKMLTPKRLWWPARLLMEGSTFWYSP